MTYVLLTGLLLMSLIASFLLGKKVSKLKEQVSQLLSSVDFERKVKEALKEAALRQVDIEKAVEKIEDADTDEQIDQIYRDIIDGRI